jgi:hypothetical protein
VELHVRGFHVRLYTLENLHQAATETIEVRVTEVLKHFSSSHPLKQQVT